MGEAEQRGDFVLGAPPAVVVVGERELGFGRGGPQSGGKSGVLFPVLLGGGEIKLPLGFAGAQGVERGLLWVLIQQRRERRACFRRGAFGADLARGQRYGTEEDIAKRTARFDVAHPLGDGGHGGEGAEQDEGRDRGS